MTTALMTTTPPTTKPARRTKKAISPEEQQRRERQSRQSKQALAVVPEYLSPKIAGQMFGLSAWSTRELVRQGLVEGKRYGQRRVLVSYSSLKEYVESLPNAKTTRPSAVG
jgi:hypothetical protein